MNVEMELVAHPKYRALRRAVGPEALEYLVRLWGHCASNKRGEYWPKATADYVEAVCDWGDDRGVLFQVLVDVGFIDVPADGVGVVVHDWNEQNSFTVQNWNRNPHGRRGKTVGYTVDKPTVCPAEPVDNPRGTHGEPLRMSEESDKSEESERARSLREETEPHIPTWDEFRSAAEFSAAAVPEDYLRRQFQGFEHNLAWLTKFGQLRPWKRIVTDRWASDRMSWKPSGKGPEKKPAASPAQQLYAVSLELEDLEKKLDALHERDAEIDPKDRERERELRRLKAGLESGGNDKVSDRATP